MPSGVQNKPDWLVLEGFISAPPLIVACKSMSGMCQVLSLEKLIPFLNSISPKLLTINIALTFRFLKVVSLNFILLRRGFA